MVYIAILAALSMTSAIAGAIIGHPRNAHVRGFWYGFLLGPIGAIAAFRSDNRPECPWCREQHNWAKHCPHCGFDIKA